MAGVLERVLIEGGCWLRVLVDGGCWLRVLKRLLVEGVEKAVG